MFLGRKGVSEEPGPWPVILGTGRQEGLEEPSLPAQQGRCRQVGLVQESSCPSPGLGWERGTSHPSSAEHSSSTHPHQAWDSVLSRKTGVEISLECDPSAHSTRANNSGCSCRCREAPTSCLCPQVSPTDMVQTPAAACLTAPGCSACTAPALLSASQMGKGS